jgi:hypothetical protein
MNDSGNDRERGANKKRVYQAQHPKAIPPHEAFVSDGEIRRRTADVALETQ